MSSQRRSSDIAREQFGKFNFESKGKGFSDRASHGLQCILASFVLSLFHLPCFIVLLQRAAWLGCSYAPCMCAARCQDALQLERLNLVEVSAVLR
jgi:hypothetical protein